MTATERIRKLHGHAENLLDAFRGLRFNIAMLEPLIEDEDLKTQLSSGNRKAGFAALRQTLFLACALDVAKLCFDKDGRTPSIANVMMALSDPAVVTALRDQNTRFDVPREAGDADSETELEAYENSERETLGRKFDETLRQLQSEWRALESSPLKTAFSTLRDKYTAHLELRFVNGSYQPIDIAALGLKWTDPGNVARAMEPLVLGIGLLVRDSDFDMSGAVKQFQQISAGFWSTAS